MKLYLEPTPEQLRSARSWLGWNLDDAAEATGVNRGTISRIEQELSQGTRDTIKRLATAYADAGIWLDENQITYVEPELVAL